MNIKEYIESGILEMYVAGVLTEKENHEVYEAIQQHPELQAEVKAIEGTIRSLTTAVSPGPAASFSQIEPKLSNGETKVIAMQPKTPMLTYLAYAASVLFLVGIFSLYNQNQGLQNELQAEQQKTVDLEQQIAELSSDVERKDEFLAVLTDNDISPIPLNGQGQFAQTFAKVYWDKNSNEIYLDVNGLPEPPEGKVYQVWSLAFDPLTPTSLGTLDEFKIDRNKIFKIENTNPSQGFGITLEPEGGSVSPTLEQLYTLGTV